MGTSIHAGVPNSCFCDGFFFDHEYMFKCNKAQTQSVKALNACPGSAYFKFQQKFFEDHCRVYTLFLIGEYCFSLMLNILNFLAF